MKIKGIKVSYLNREGERVSVGRMVYAQARIVKSVEQMKSIAKSVKQRPRSRALKELPHAIIIEVKIEGGRWFLWKE